MGACRYSRLCCLSFFFFPVSVACSQLFIAATRTKRKGVAALIFFFFFILSLFRAREVLSFLLFLCTFAALKKVALKEVFLQ